MGGHPTSIAHVCYGFPALPDGYGRNTPTGRCTGNYCNQDATATLFYGSAPGVGAISVGFGFQRDPDQSGYTSRAWGATYSGGAGLYPSPTCQQDRVPAHGGYGACRHDEPANPGRTLEFCEDGTAPQQVVVGIELNPLLEEERLQYETQCCPSGYRLGFARGVPGITCAASSQSSIDPAAEAFRDYYARASRPAWLRERAHARGDAHVLPLLQESPIFTPRQAPPPVTPTVVVNAPALVQVYRPLTSPNHAIPGNAPGALPPAPPGHIARYDNLGITPWHASPALSCLEGKLDKERGHCILQAGGTTPLRAQPPIGFVDRDDFWVTSGDGDGD